MRRKHAPKARIHRPAALPSATAQTSTHGLQNRTDTGPVEPPTSVYDVLASSGAEKRTVPGEQEPAYRLGEHDAFLSIKGEVFCGAHRNKLPPLTKAIAYGHALSRPSAASAAAA